MQLSPGAAGLQGCPDPPPPPPPPAGPPLTGTGALVRNRIGDIEGERRCPQAELERQPVHARLSGGRWQPVSAHEAVHPAEEMPAHQLNGLSQRKLRCLLQASLKGVVSANLSAEQVRTAALLLPAPYSMM